jgi:hypothetical protein
MGRQTGSKVADFSYTRTDNSHSTKIRSITTPTTVTKSLPWPFPGFWVDYYDLPLSLVSVSVSIFFPVSISIIVVIIVVVIVCINLVANNATDYGPTDRSTNAALRQNGARDTTDSGAGQGVLVLS